VGSTAETAAACGTGCRALLRVNTLSYQASIVMNILFDCPRCQNAVRQEFRADTTHLQCTTCGTSVRVNVGCLRDGKLEKCLVCPSTDLFVRKNFPPRVGVSIVAIGFGLSCITWYQHLIQATFGILFATALLDVVLYVLVGDIVECYRCHARYGGVSDPVSHGAFDLEVHERHRQQQARLAK
jgi:hypothetical protein